MVPRNSVQGQFADKHRLHKRRSSLRGRTDSHKRTAVCTQRPEFVRVQGELVCKDSFVYGDSFCLTIVVCIRMVLCTRIVCV